MKSYMGSLVITTALGFPRYEQWLVHGVMDQRLMEYQLRLGAEGDLRSWYECVPTEANISGWPSRSQPHELLDSALNVSGKAWEKLQTILRYLAC